MSLFGGFFITRKSSYDFGIARISSVKDILNGHVTRQLSGAFYLNAVIENIDVDVIWPKPWTVVNPEQDARVCHEFQVVRVRGNSRAVTESAAIGQG